MTSNPMNMLNTILALAAVACGPSAGTQVAESSGSAERFVREAGQRFTSTLVMNDLSHAKSDPSSSTAQEVALPDPFRFDGVVLRPDGRPAQGASLAPLGRRDALGNFDVQISNGALVKKSSTAPVVETDASGHFRWTNAFQWSGVMVVHESGYAEVPTNKLGRAIAVHLQPWARIKGVAKTGTRPWTFQRIAIWDMRNQVYFDESWYKTTTDLEGRFSFDHVPPGEWALHRDFIVSADSRQHEPAMSIRIAPGEVSRVVYGGLGRPVVGRVAVNDAAVPITPALLRQNHFDRPIDEGRGRELWIIGCETNGSFRLDNVKSGTYELYIGLKDTDPNARSLRGQVRMKVKVPEAAGGVSDEALDLGTLTIDVHPEERVELGDFGEAPDFEIPTSDGGRVTLHSQRGKFVLLDFWATWCGPCIREIPNLKEVHKAFGRGPRLVLVGLNIDEKNDTWQKAVVAHKLEWIQGYAGPPTEGGVTTKYGVEGYPAIFLINPEGRIIAKNLRGKSIFAAVNKALKAASGLVGE